MHRLVRSLLLVLTASWTATAVFGAPPEPRPVVRDDAGLDVRLERPARRVVSLSPSLTELLFEIGAGDRIVAATEYSDFPDAARAIPRVGGLSGIDIEHIAALQPDVVVAWLSGTSRAQLDALERLHIPVYRSEPHTLDDVTSTVRRLGVLTGRTPAADAVIARFDDRAQALRRRYADRAPVRVFFQVWNKPLMTVGGPQLITQLISLCGGRNVFASLAPLAPLVDVEAVIAADPQLIVTASANRDRVDEAVWNTWTGVSAVRAHRYLYIDPALVTRHTSRVLDGAQMLCAGIDAARDAGPAARARP